MDWIPRVSAYVDRVVANLETITPTRRQLLSGVAEYISARISSGDNARLVFICTHNSRRSQMGEVFCRIAATYFQLPSIETASGGNEVTACHPHTLAAFERAGMQVNYGNASTNPMHEICFAHSEPVIRAYSKRFETVGTPDSPFAAMMCCDQADQNCPIIAGAEARFALQYSDPKVADGTDREPEVYDERCLEIATEMFAVGSLLASKP
ncbi:MAG: protein-tyrosine-phosphatase [Planctomycetota bacterium]